MPMFRFFGNMIRRFFRKTIPGLLGTKIPFQRRQKGVAYFYDYSLLATVILLLGFGLVMLYSTSAYTSLVETTQENLRDASVKITDMSYFERQAIIAVISLVLVIVFSQLDYHFYSYFSWLVYFASLGLMLAVYVVGFQANGATRWIRIGPLNLQPSEIAKVAIIMLIPRQIVLAGRRIRDWKVVVKILILGVVAAGFCFVFTENLSTALIIGGIAYLLILIVSKNLPKLILFSLSTLLAGIVLVIALIWVDQQRPEEDRDFRIRRIVNWLNPEEEDEEGNYQAIQAKYAIGSGGYLGKGLGNSTQKLGALPEAHNDMIFSIVCEELGLFGALILTLLYAYLLSRLMMIAMNAPDLLGSLMAIGIFIHIALQVVLNIAVVTGVIPTTGIALPFVSYGGTYILFLMVEMMLALSISRSIRLD